MSIQIIKDTCEKRLRDLDLYKKKEYLERLHRELKAIQGQEMSLYLLDCAEKAKTSGKVKNSNHMLVTFLLEISDEDPIKTSQELIKTKYEEFPDIDSDFEDAKRDLVKQYLVDKYGSANVASIVAFGKNKAKNTIKDIARIKNIPYEEVNEVNKHLKGGAKPDTIEEGYNKYPKVREFFDKYAYVNLYNICRKIEGNVRQPSRHAAGLVISPVPLTDIVGLMVAKGDVITCWEEGIEHKELSKVGLIKMDLLGLNTLTVIHETLKYIKKREGKELNLSVMDLGDIAVIRQFHDANTVGVFQFEKQDLRTLMSKIKITSFADISHVNALNRPGPLGTGMDELFWKVKNGVEPQTYLHPKLEPTLKDTYGIMIYQEQIIKIVQDLAGYTADEADNFRRVLTKEAQAGRSKGINPLEKYEKNFIQNSIDRGVAGRINVTRTIYDDIEIPSTAKDIKTIKEEVDESGVPYKTISCSVEISDEVFHRIKSFAEYGFNKCLTGDTKIKLANHSVVKLSTLFTNKRLIPKLKDVMSFDEEGKTILANHIADVTESGIQDVYLLTTKTRKHINATANHKIRTQAGWKELGNIGMNDKILVQKADTLIWEEIAHIKYQGKEMTYDVSLADQTHPYFFANNIGVHNSHSTAYAYLAFQCMFLKTYYPKEYMATLLTYTPNSEGNDDINYFITYIEETRRMGLKILPPDINKSMKEFTVDGDNILSGFLFLKGVGARAIQEIIDRRPYKSIIDFLMKTNARVLNKTVFHALVHCGAFDQFLKTPDITERYQFINDFNKFKKIKTMELKPSMLKEIEKEIEVCGAEIFNSPIKAFNLKDINKKFEADDKILDFKSLDKIEPGSEIRIYGKVERFFTKNVGFIDIKCGLDKRTFMLWSNDLEYLEKHEDKKALIDKKAIITFRAKRGRDYNGRKTFLMVPGSIEELQNN